MSIESQVNPNTIRRIHVKGSDKYEQYVQFVAKGTDNKLLRYNQDAESGDDVTTGPTLDINDGRFITNNQGRWEAIRPGCSGLLTYYMSPRVKFETPDQHTERIRRERAALNELFN